MPTGPRGSGTRPGPAPRSSPSAPKQPPRPWPSAPTARPCSPGGPDKTARLWDAATGQTARAAPDPSGAGDGRRLPPRRHDGVLTGSQDYDLRGPGTRPLGPGPAASPSLHPRAGDGRRLQPRRHDDPDQDHGPRPRGSGTSDTGLAPGTGPADSRSGLRAVAFSPDGGIVYTATKLGLRRFDLTRDPLAFMPRSIRMLCGTWTGGIHFLRPDGGLLQSQYTAPRPTPCGLRPWIRPPRRATAPRGPADAPRRVAAEKAGAYSPPDGRIAPTYPIGDLHTRLPYERHLTSFNRMALPPKGRNDSGLSMDFPASSPASPETRPNPRALLSKDNPRLCLGDSRRLHVQRSYPQIPFRQLFLPQGEGRRS